MPGYVLRPADSDDVEFLTDVVVVVTKDQGRWPAELCAPDAEAEWRAGFSDWTREQLGGDVDGSTTSVVLVDGDRVGRHRVVRAPDHVELAGVQLLPAHQGRGIGTQVVRDVLAEARDQGVPARISVEQDNPRARALYERLGFTAYGETERDVLLEAR